jgi:hypothetical protein
MRAEASRVNGTTALISATRKGAHYTSRRSRELRRVGLVFTWAVFGTIHDGTFEYGHQASHGLELVGVDRVDATARRVAPEWQ